MLKRLGLVLLFLGIGNYSFSQSVSFIPNGSLTGVTSSGSSTTFTVPILGTSAFFTGPVSIGNTSASPYANLYGDAANTLALRNSTNAQTFNIYNTYTDASNYERLGIKTGSGNYFGIGSEIAGTGTNKATHVFSAWPGGLVGIGGSFVTGPQYQFTATGVGSVNNDTQILGGSTGQWRTLYLSRSIEGSKSKALTESSATSFTQVAVPQTAGANHAAGKVIYEVYATDGTDSQSLTGEVFFSAVNKAGTETCSIGLVGTEVLSVSAVSTLTCTHTCVTGLTDVVQIASNCVSSLVQTTFTIQSRLDMPQPNTVTPQ